MTNLKRNILPLFAAAAAAALLLFGCASSETEVIPLGDMDAEQEEAAEQEIPAEQEEEPPVCCTGADVTNNVTVVNLLELAAAETKIDFAGDGKTYNSFGSDDTNRALVNGLLKDKINTKKEWTLSLKFVGLTKLPGANESTTITIEGLWNDTDRKVSFENVKIEADKDGKVTLTFAKDPYSFSFLSSKDNQTHSFDLRYLHMSGGVEGASGGIKIVNGLAGVIIPCAYLDSDVNAYLKDGDLGSLIGEGKVPMDTLKELVDFDLNNDKTVDKTTVENNPDGISAVFIVEASPAQ